MSAIDRPMSVFDDFYRPFSGFFGQGFPGRLAHESEAWLPAVDIHRENGAYTISMDVPGFTSEGIDVEAHDGVLTISGERVEDTASDGRESIRRERRVGKFVRRFNLPKTVSNDEISARVTNGVLSITIPDAVAAAPKKITIE